MKQNRLTRSIRAVLTGTVGIGFTLTSVISNAADTPATAKVEKITVTGSSIKGVASQSSSPISIVRTEDLAKQGVTTAEEALSTVSANQSSFVAASNVGRSGTAGSVADLRGLGPNKTLVLLNGRRLANTPFDTSTVDLSTIPLALIDRIEVLKDGASAIYGTDAIGGVINFITKKQYQGAGVTVEGAAPQKSGGDKQNYSLFGGYGSLEDQGFNVYGAATYGKQDSVMANQREASRRGGILPELGVNRTSGSSFPANIPGIGNPYASTGCGDTTKNTVSGKNCRYNSQADIGIIPEEETFSVLGKGTLKLTDNLNAIAEYVHSENRMTTTVAPDVLAGGGSDYYIPSTSSYYPGKGITPAISGANGQDLSLNIRSQAGNRISETTQKADRVLLGLDGSVADWDINTGISYAKSQGEDSLYSGYIDNQKVRDNLANGTLNPFGASANANIWNSMSISGLSQSAQLESTNFDFTASRAIFTLPAGDVGFAVGGGLRRDEWSQTQNAAVNSLVASTGVDSTKGASTGTRNLKAVFTELQVPIFKSLSAQLAARYDDYSDFGGTFNPKVALRWEPVKQFMMRGSFSTGFRAPSLYEMHSANYKTYTAASWNDPVLCKGGTPTAGGNAVRDCNTQFYAKTGGNSSLEAEKSKTFTVGFVYEPIKNVVLSVDYFNIEVKNQVSAPTESAIFSDPVKYAANYVRKSDGSLDYVNESLQNMGGTKTSGIDLGIQWRSPMSQYGRLTLGIDGTYVDRYKFQTEKGGQWYSAVGQYNSNFGSVITRWKHNANVNWSYDTWSLNLQQTFFKGYVDQNVSDQNHKVSNYTLYNLSGSYTGFKNTSITLGIKNVLNAQPPKSNVVDNFQMGYDARYSDAMGRTYFGRVTYKF
ncbi:TonB-dependent receptor [Acinetobacter boissieri]|uniref:Iron complex outermembrane recepter protein n=1 Tax=Acinetobacter boissieri TaxID=1219383 RepID=A0A1G6H0U4_9GAMM|nr:TonB-dependent receptor [Acinetobacter boissieri]SDB87774.1 iron complex outermembrane recepter protein [Acinetobacter boissieri]